MNILIFSLSGLAIFSPLLSIIKNEKLKKILINIFFLLVILSFGFRSRNTPDTKAYENIFYNIYTLDENIQRLESLYKIFIKINLQLLKEFRLYLLLITFSFFFFWKRITKNFVNDLSIIFGTFFLTYGIYFFGITQRQALAFLIAYLGLKQIVVNNKNSSGIILIIISSFIHSSMIMYLLVIYFAKKEISTIYLKILIISSLIFSIFSTKFLSLMFLLESILEILKLNHYKAYLIFNSGLSLNTFYYTMLAFLFLEYRKKIKTNRFVYNFFLNFYITGVLILNFLSFFKGVSRLADIFLIFFSIIVGNIFFNIQKKENKLIMILLIVINNILLITISVKNLSSFYTN